MPKAQNTYTSHCGLDPQSRHAGADSASTQWYAARIIGSDSIITKRLAYDGIHCYRTKFAPSVIFMRCTMSFVTGLLSEFWGKLYFYLNPERKHPSPISEKEMNNFILVTSVTSDLITFSDVTEEFLKGDRVRVTGGLFEGAKGVVKARQRPPASRSFHQLLRRHLPYRPGVSGENCRIVARTRVTRVLRNFSAGRKQE